MLNNAVKIMAVAVITVTAFILGFYIGVDNEPESVEGVYNIEYNHDTGTVVIKTKIDYISTEDDDLIVNGKPTFKAIE